MSSLFPSHSVQPFPAAPPAQVVQAVEPDRSLDLRVAAAQGAGIVAAARLQAGAFTASVAMSNAVMLSRAADTAFRVSPMGEEVYRAIFHAYGSVAVNEIQRLGFHAGGLR